MNKTYYVAASRGRNPDNPGLRISGIQLEQRLEIQKDNILNTLTSVQKDNYIIECIKREDNMSEVDVNRLGNIYGYDGGNYGGNVYSKEGICPNINTMGGGNRQPLIVEQIPILTSAKKTQIASTILSGYHRTNMTGFNADNGVLVKVEK